jgi:hypothetical protein
MLSISPYIVILSPDSVLELNEWMNDNNNDNNRKKYYTTSKAWNIQRNKTKHITKDNKAFVMMG